MITPRLLRQVNATRCLRLLQDGATLSRADMARALGQTRATVGHAVAELLEAGLVRESDPMLGKMGRPGTALRLAPDGAAFIGVEVDTRAITGVLLNLGGEIAARRTFATDGLFADPSAMAGKIAALVRDLAGRTTTRVQGVNLAIPGLIGRAGEVVVAPLLGWRDVPLRQALASLPWPVEVINDAFALAAAEPAGPDLLLVFLAEGIGAAQISGGRLIAGAHGFAGEIGHMRIATATRTGKFDSMAGAAAFPQVMTPGRSVEDGVAALLAGADDPATRAALSDWAEALATGLANAALLTDPDRIVLGGPLSLLYPLVRDRVASHLSDLCHTGAPPVALARHASAGAAIGAAMHLRDRMFALPDLGERERA